MVNLYLVLEYFELVRYCLMDPEYKHLCRDIWRKQLRMSRQQKLRRSATLTQHRRMMKAIHDLYARDETFLDFLAHDLDDDAVWFNNSEDLLDGIMRFHIYMASPTPAEQIVVILEYDPDYFSALFEDAA